MHCTLLEALFTIDFLLLLFFNYLTKYSDTKLYRLSRCSPSRRRHTPRQSTHDIDVAPLPRSHTHTHKDIVNMFNCLYSRKNVRFFHKAEERRGKVKWSAGRHSAWRKLGLCKQAKSRTKINGKHCKQSTRKMAFRFVPHRNWIIFMTHSLIIFHEMLTANLT